MFRIHFRINSSCRLSIWATSIADNTLFRVSWWGISSRSGIRLFRFSQNIGRLISLVASRDEAICRMNDITPRIKRTDSLCFVFFAFLGSGIADNRFKSIGSRSRNTFNSSQVASLRATPSSSTLW